MYVVIRSGGGGMLNEDAYACGCFIDYDDAFSALKAKVLDEADAIGIDLDSEGEYGFDYDSGHGFAGAFAGPEFQIFEVGKPV